MEYTFKKTLRYLSASVDEKGERIMEPVEKSVSFYKLSQTDPKQARLFFMMRPLYRSVNLIGEDTTQLIADPNIMYDLTIKAIESLLIVDEKEFTEQDKIEFMNDTFAVMSFGEWFLQDSSAFFLSYLTNYLKLEKTQK